MKLISEAEFKRLKFYEYSYCRFLYYDWLHEFPFMKPFFKWISNHDDRRQIVDVRDEIREKYKKTNSNEREALEQANARILFLEKQLRTLLEVIEIKKTQEE